MSDVAAIETHLRGFERVVTERPGRPAAVAIALLRTVGGTDAADGSWCFPLTVRSSGLREHAGQYALPGGRLAAGETHAAAAARETAEEVGLPEALWRRHYLLDDYVTRSGHVITPVVLVADTPAPVLRPNPDEVHAAFYVSLGELGEVEPRAAYDDSGDRAFALHVAHDIVFAPTGAVLLQFRDLVLEGRTTRVQDVGEPVFAWS